MTTAYQLWCYYETRDVWIMEGFFRTYDQAMKHLVKLRDDVETPCMPDYLVMEVKVEW